MEIKCPNCKNEFEVDETKYNVDYVGCPNCYAFFRNKKYLSKEKEQPKDL